MEFKIGPEIYFGRGKVGNLRKINLTRVMVIADGFLIQNRMIELLTDTLEGMGVKYVVFSDVKPDTPLAKVRAGVELMNEFKPNEIIGIGGGSAIDTSKAIKYFGEKLEDMRGEKPKRLIIIPTTSGTGSEVTRYAVVLDEDTNLKHTIIDESVLPDYAILDTDFIRDLPTRVAITSGLDVLVHGIEAYVAKGANEITDMFALKAITHVFDYLPRVVEEGGPIAREKMHLASLLAGIAFENAGLGINHSLAHVLGGVYKIPHGEVNAIILPYVVRFNGEKMVENKYLKLAGELGVLGLGKDIKFNNLILKIEKFLDDLGIAKNISYIGGLELDFNSYEQGLGHMAELALSDGNTETNPVDVTKLDLESLLLKIYGR